MPQPYTGRINGVLLIPPGVDDPDARIKRRLSNQMASAIRNVVERDPGFSHIEILYIPVDTTHLVYLHGYKESESGSTSREMQPLESHGTHLFCEMLDDHLPGYVGIETGDLDLSPLRLWEASTHRAVGMSDSWSPLADNRVLRWTRTGDSQYTIVQLLLTPKPRGESFDLTFRVLKTGNRPPITEAEIAHRIQNNSSGPFASPVYSSQELLTDETALETITVDGNRYPSTPPKFLGSNRHLAKERRARAALTSETVGFAAALPLTSQYSSWSHLSCVPVPLEQLDQWLYVPSIGGRVVSKSPDYRPLFTTRKRHRSATGTDTTTVLPDATLRTNRALSVQPEDTAREWLVPNASDAVFQPRSVLPHLTDNTLLDGMVALYDYSADIPDTAIGTLGGLLHAITGTIKSGNHLWIIAADKKSAQQATDLLRQPFKDIDGKFGVPYQSLYPMRLKRGTELFYPADAAISWRLSADRSWQILKDGRVRGNGREWPPDGSIISADLKLFRISDENHSRHVDRPSEVMDVVPSMPFGEYRRLAVPMVPPRPVLMQDATVLLHTQTGLKPWFADPSWHDRDRDRPPAERALSVFAETHFVTRANLGLATPRLQEMAARYFLNQRSVCRTSVPEAYLQIMNDPSLDGRIDPEATAWPLPYRNIPQP